MNLLQSMLFEESHLVCVRACACFCVKWLCENICVDKWVRHGSCCFVLRMFCQMLPGLVCYPLGIYGGIRNITEGFYKSIPDSEMKCSPVNILDRWDLTNVCGLRAFCLSLSLGICKCACMVITVVIHFPMPDTHKHFHLIN